MANSYSIVDPTYVPRRKVSNVRLTIPTMKSVFDAVPYERTDLIIKEPIPVGEMLLNGLYVNFCCSVISQKHKDTLTEI